MRAHAIADAERLRHRFGAPAALAGLNQSSGVALSIEYLLANMPVPAGSA